MMHGAPPPPRCDSALLHAPGVSAGNTRLGSLLVPRLQRFLCAMYACPSAKAYRTRFPTLCQWPQGEQNVTSHLMKDNEWEYKAERVLKHAARGPDCWDCEFYKSSNVDLAELPCHDAFAHFVNFGQFEPSRPFRCALLHTTHALHACSAMLALECAQC